MWSCYNNRTINKLRVGYNNVFRRLFKINHWNEEEGRVESVTDLCNEKGIRSFSELYAYISLNCKNRIAMTENVLIMNLLNSDAFTCSRQWSHWEKMGL